MAFFLFLIVFAVPLGAQKPASPQVFLKAYCAACHQGKKPAAGYDVTRLTPQSLREEPRLWRRALARVREYEMPPPKAPAPSIAAREQFVTAIDTALTTAACADGISPGRAITRRLNKAEYAASVRDLLNIHINAGASLPVDGAGGEGFDNAAETLFLSPVHAEKYLEAAKVAVDYAFKDPRSRGAFLIAEPKDGVTGEQAARKVMEAFLPRAFRRPVPAAEAEKYVGLYRLAAQRGDSYDSAMAYAIQGVLLSPNFLFRIEEPNAGLEPRAVPPYELASRISYFLWGTTPDKELLELAAAGKLGDEEVLRGQVKRMLSSERTREFAENFVEQWLGTRELGRDIKPDPELFKPYYEPEVQSGIRYEPILFFQELLLGDLPVLDLLDSKWTVMSNKLQRYYGHPATPGLRQQPKKVDLPENSRRGGLLGMSAILAVTSMPTRTSPVLRGKWILEAILGTPTPPPPPNVPELDKEHAGAPKTMRERLSQHRASPNCAGCHNRIDPLGFGLENYDVIGRFRSEDAGKPIDASGELTDGTRFDGATELKKVLLERKDLFLRNLTAKVLGYALGRGLTLEDNCAVDQIVEQLKRENYSTHALIRGIVLSTPFRYQLGEASRPPSKPVSKTREGRS